MICAPASGRRSSSSGEIFSCFTAQVAPDKVLTGTLGTSSKFIAFIKSSFLVILFFSLMHQVRQKHTEWLQKYSKQ